MLKSVNGWQCSILNLKLECPKDIPYRSLVRVGLEIN